MLRNKSVFFVYSMESEVCLPSVEISESDLTSLQHSEVLEVGYTEITQNESETRTADLTEIKAETEDETNLGSDIMANQIDSSITANQNDQKTRNQAIVLQMEGGKGSVPVENVFQMENELGDGGYIILSGDAAGMI